MDIEKLIDELTLEEKAVLVSGRDFMFTNAIPRLNIPQIRMSDGPHGLRVQDGGWDNGVSNSLPATAFPTAACTASGWNADNTRKMGEAIAKECLHYGVNILLGPANNIKRNPLCGRNFEYFSEDPCLAGVMATAEVEGVQKGGVGVAVKHFALNNSENYRFMGDSVCDMRAVREIYLKAFEPVIKQGKPHTVMSAYNKINGKYCCENKWLLTDVLRDEWGFDGVVMTDWGSMHDRVEALRAGLDLEMPGDTAICRKWIIDGVNSGVLDVQVLDKAVKNILNLVKKYENQQREQADFAAHHALAAEIAEDCAVLLKNDGVLPLNKSENLLIVGDLFEKMRYQGSGSSMINPAFLTTPKIAFENSNLCFKFVRGYEENAIAPNAQLISEAVKASGGHQIIVVFAGLTDHVESEGCDRENMRLPENQLTLIDALIKTGKKIVVVLYGGSPVELPFAESVSAILNMYLPGQNGGTATCNLLFGDKCPSGRLAETWVKEYKDVPFGDEYAKTINEIYRESIFVGYRYYLTAKKEVRYPFGHGLSYTTFDYSDIKLEQEEDKITVSCTVTNTGKLYGAEVVQLYVKAPRGGVFKPEKELRGFSKVYLKPGEWKRVEITVSKDDLRYWDIKDNCWALENGEYEFQLCHDCMTVKLSAKLTTGTQNCAYVYEKEVNSIYHSVRISEISDEVFEQMSGLKIPKIPPLKPIRLDSRFSDIRATFFGRIIYKAVLGFAEKHMKEALKLPDGAERDNKIKGAAFLQRVLESNSLITMSMSAGKSCPYNYAQGLAHLANGHIFKGIKCFCTKIKVKTPPKKN
ncbi:MAG: glycoside hydrolase family 3 C-terminal domain-containing protein [Clostridiales bacterium]|nr:glycoside hydrolase family 3 C-terminal domain-containing protein [Clostridiales bacterium]